MRRMKNQVRLATIIGVVLLLFVIYLSSLLRNSPAAIVTQQEQSATAPSATSALGEEILPVITWVPTTGADGEEPPWPTETPAPTHTPRPTATPRSGATATPFPTRVAASNPEGKILYMDEEQANVFRISINEQGQLVDQLEAIPSITESGLALFDGSPDGHYLLLIQTSAGHGIPYVYNATTQVLSPVFKDEGTSLSQYFGWHPDSRHILYGQLGSGLELVNVETGLVTMLAVANASIQGAAISPDGQSVIYIAESHLSYQTVWRAEASGLGARILFDLGGTGYIFDWSPNSEKILYMGGPGADQALEQETAQGPLWLMDAEGKTRQPLNGPFIAGFGFEPVWSPDGEWLAFTGLSDGEEYGCAHKDPAPQWPQCQFEGSAIYVVHAKTGELRALAKGIQPIWSPDGSMLAFISNQTGISELWLVDREGNNLQQLTNGAGVSHAVWTVESSKGL